MPLDTAEMQRYTPPLERQLRCENTPSSSSASSLDRLLQVPRAGCGGGGGGLGDGGLLLGGVHAPRRLRSRLVGRGRRLGHLGLQAPRFSSQHLDLLR